MTCGGNVAQCLEQTQQHSPHYPIGIDMESFPGAQMLEVDIAREQDCYGLQFEHHIEPTSQHLPFFPSSMHPVFTHVARPTSRFNHFANLLPFRFTALGSVPVDHLI